MLEIGKRIRQCRERIGMTQDELAQATGYKSRSSINKIEKGGNDLPQSKIVIFAKALSTTPSYLMGWDTPRYGMRLKEKRIISRKSLAELSDISGISVRKLAEFECNVTEPTMDELTAIAQAYGLSLSEFLSNDFEKTETDISAFDNIKPVQLKRFPMLGEIACGEPIWTDEDHESHIMADMDIKADFCLRAKGDSMINARIYDGDIVFIKEMPIVENGDIAAVIIDNEATLKRFYYDKENNYLQLIAEKPLYKPLVYRNEQLDQIRVLGKAVYFMSAL